MKIAFFPLLFAAVLPVTAIAGGLAPTKSEVKKFDKADTNDDESISSTEFAALMKALTKAKQGGPGVVLELQAAADAFFDWFDSDNNNGIDLGEWFAARTSTPEDPGIPDVLTFPGFDLNGNDFITTGEFVKVLKELIPAKFALAIFKALPPDA